MPDGRKACRTGFYDAILINFSCSNLGLVTVVEWRVLWSRRKFRRTLIVKI
jgi:hypothetical protein